MDGFRSASEQRVVSKLLETLQQLPGAHASLRDVQRTQHSRPTIDAAIDFSLSNDHVIILVEAKRDVFPRDTREVLWQLRDYVRHLSGKDVVIPIVAAESISPGSKELLKQENVGYFDLGGSLFLPARGAYILIDKPTPKPFARSVGSVFRGKRSHILRVLLHHNMQWLSVKMLAEKAGVSAATTSETLIALERFDWLETQGQGPSKERRLIAARALLDEWKKQIQAGQKPKMRRYYVPNATINEAFERRVDAAFVKARIPYVLTQESAAQHYAPFLTSVSRVVCRASSAESDPALKELDAREVSEGANFSIIESSNDDGAFLYKERCDSAWLASPIQVYLDLQMATGRAQEAADHLRKERIGF
jgi:Transcriptional regulator, AbiEi antitoxin, Type IV TA system